MTDKTIQPSPIELNTGSDGDGFGRLVDLLQELQRILIKRELVFTFGDAERAAELDLLIDELKQAIADAAEVEAQREIAEAAKDAGRLRDGDLTTRPRTGEPGGSTTGEKDDCCGCSASAVVINSNDNSSVNVVSNEVVTLIDIFNVNVALALAGAVANGGQADGTGMRTPCIFVQGERTVWAWNPYAQRWEAQTFAQPLVEVKLVPGGILAVAEGSAALFDCTFYRWLAVLDSGGERLSNSDAR